METYKPIDLSMTVKELMDLLSKLDPNEKILMAKGNNDYDDIIGVEQRSVLDWNDDETDHIIKEYFVIY